MQYLGNTQKEEIKMKRFILILLSLIILITAVLSLSSCDFLAELANAALEMSENGDTTSPTQVQIPTTPTEPVNAIPFINTPSIDMVSLPEEIFTDPVEKEASDIIDDAIEKALSYLNVMKDDRHSNVTYHYDENANGYYSELDKNEKNLLKSIVSAGKKGEGFKIKDSEYSGDLKDAFFDLYAPFTYLEPDLSSYIYMDVTSYISGSDLSSHYSSLFIRYYDPYKDGNYTVDKGSVTLDEVLHAASLLDHIVKRIVRFMPSDISTYDKYYYLAAVLSEHVSYDARPDNQFTAFGALVCGKAVCEGYSNAFLLLCREADLWCAYRDGIPDGITGHAWNMIKLDSGIYNIDVTWCDNNVHPYEKTWYDYFIKSDEDFADHGATSGVEGTGDYEPCPYEK